MQQKGLQKVEESQNPDLILTASGGEYESTSYNVWGDARDRRRHGRDFTAAECRFDNGHQPL